MTPGKNMGDPNTPPPKFKVKKLLDAFGSPSVSQKSIKGKGMGLLQRAKANKKIGAPSLLTVGRDVRPVPLAREVAVGVEAKVGDGHKQSLLDGVNLDARLNETSITSENTADSILHSAKYRDEQISNDAEFHGDDIKTAELGGKSQLGSSFELSQPAQALLLQAKNETEEEHTPEKNSQTKPGNANTQAGYVENNDTRDSNADSDSDSDVDLGLSAEELSRYQTLTTEARKAEVKAGAEKGSDSAEAGLASAAGRRTTYSAASSAGEPAGQAESQQHPAPPPPPQSLWESNGHQMWRKTALKSFEGDASEPQENSASKRPTGPVVTRSRVVFAFVALAAVALLACSRPTWAFSRSNAHPLPEIDTSVFTQETLPVAPVAATKDTAMGVDEKFGTGTADAEVLDVVERKRQVRETMDLLVKKSKGAADNGRREEEALFSSGVVRVAEGGEEDLMARQLEEDRWERASAAVDVLAEAAKEDERRQRSKTRHSGGASTNQSGGGEAVPTAAAAAQQEEEDERGREKSEKWRQRFLAHAAEEAEARRVTVEADASARASAAAAEAAAAANRASELAAEEEKAAKLVDAKRASEARASAYEAAVRAEARAASKEAAEAAATHRARLLAEVGRDEAAIEKAAAEVLRKEQRERDAAKKNDDDTTYAAEVDANGDEGAAREFVSAVQARQRVSPRAGDQFDSKTDNEETLARSIASSRGAINDGAGHAEKKEAGAGKAATASSDTGAAKAAWRAELQEKMQRKARERFAAAEATRAQRNAVGQVSVHDAAVAAVVDAVTSSSSSASSASSSSSTTPLSSSSSSSSSLAEPLPINADPDNDDAAKKAAAKALSEHAAAAEEEERRQRVRQRHDEAREAKLRADAKEAELAERVAQLEVEHAKAVAKEVQEAADAERQRRAEGGRVEEVRRRQQEAALAAEELARLVAADKAMQIEK